MKRTLTILFAGCSILLALAQSALAIPAFAKKYGYNCNMCHVAFPKLNDWGQRFRDNGYQIPGQQGLEKTVFEAGIVPLALRTTAGYSLYDGDGQSAGGFHLYNLDLLAAGTLHKNISFLFVYTPRIDEPAATFAGSGNGDNPTQLAAIESANIVFSNIVRDKLNLRLGRFEPGFQMMSAKRSYYVLQPFEIYQFAGSRTSFDFSANHIGVEATGKFKPGLRYALGYINGTGANPDNNKWNDVYLALAKTFGPGEGQSAGQRIGIFGYLGWAPTDLIGGIESPLGDLNGYANRTYSRIGGNISLNWKTFNLQGLAFRGFDNQAFNELDPTRGYAFWGGIAELDWAGLPDNRLVLSGMFNWVDPPDYDAVSRIRAYSALARYYLGSWSAVNVSLHFEVTHREIGTVLPFKDNLFSVLLDFDF
jgi:hypothetical protein